MNGHCKMLAQGLKPLLVFDTDLNVFDSKEVEVSGAEKWRC